MQLYYFNILKNNWKLLSLPLDQANDNHINAHEKLEGSYKLFLSSLRLYKILKIAHIIINKYLLVIVTNK